MDIKIWLAGECIYTQNAEADFAPNAGEQVIFPHKDGKIRSVVDSVCVDYVDGSYNAYISWIQIF